MTYDLVAFELETNKEVLNWFGVLATRRFRAGDVIMNRDIRWHVVGVRNTSTEKLWLVDVFKQDNTSRLG